MSEAADDCFSGHWRNLGSEIMPSNDILLFE